MPQTGKPDHFQLQALVIINLLINPFLVKGAFSSQGLFVFSVVDPRDAVYEVYKSRSMHDCAAKCIALPCCPGYPCCTHYCQSLTSPTCYLNVTSESPSSVLLDESQSNVVCYSRGKLPCPSDLGYLLIRGQCVKAYEEKVTRETAGEKCELDRGHLYYFRDLATDEPVIRDLMALIGDTYYHYWVDAERKGSGDFRWQDGCRLSNTSSVWHTNEPSFGDGEECVELFTKSLRLNDKRCDYQLFYICQINM